MEGKIEGEKTNNLVEPKIEGDITKKQKIIKYVIISSIIIVIITTVILLLGYFQFDWFKSDDVEDENIQKLDIKIKSFANEAKYYIEKKNITSKVYYSNGEVDEKQQTINTSFVVILTDRTEVESTPSSNTSFFRRRRRKKDIITNASLIILESKSKVDNEETNLNAFNIFDQNKISEFESNPNGTQYPMAKFSYYENGTLIDTDLPTDMDEYNAQTILELINNVIPKLSRDKRHDRKHRLNVRRNKTKRGYVLTEEQEAQQYSDRFNRRQFRGSRFKKKTIRDINNENLNKIQTSTNLVLETQKNETKNGSESLDLGLKKYTVDVTSEIIAVKTEEDKKKEVQLIKKLNRRMRYVNSDRLMESLVSQTQNNITNGTKRRKNATDSQNLRNLVSWEGSFSYSRVLATANILGQEIELIYSMEFSDGQVVNTLTLESGNLVIYLGNTEGLYRSDDDEKRIKDKTLFTIPFPGCPIPVRFSFKISGVVGYDVSINPYEKEIGAELYGAIEAIAAVSAGGWSTKVEGGARGTLISLSAETSIKQESRYRFSRSNSITCSGGAITLYLLAKVFGCTVFNYERQVFSGWSRTFGN